MKAITKLMHDEPYFNTDILEILVTVSVFIFYFIVNLFVSFFVDFTSNQFITNCIALTVFTLFYYENKILDYIEECSSNNIFDVSQDYPSRKKEIKSSSSTEEISVSTIEDNDYCRELSEVIGDETPKLAFDIIGVIKSVPGKSYSLACEKIILNTIACVSEIIKIFGRKNVFFIGSGTEKEEWILKSWLENNEIVRETSILRENILFIESTPESTLSQIDEEKRKKCAELGITHYVDDREQATNIISESVHHTILFSGSKYEKSLLINNLKDYKNLTIEHTDNWATLKNLLIHSYDKYFNRKTHFKSKNDKLDCESNLNPYYFNEQGEIYIIVPFDKKNAPPQLKHISFLILHDVNKKDLVNLEDPFTAGYITDNGTISLNTKMDEVCL